MRALVAAGSAIGIAAAIGVDRSPVIAAVWREADGSARDDRRRAGAFGGRNPGRVRAGAPRQPDRSRRRYCGNREWHSIRRTTMKIRREPQAVLLGSLEEQVMLAVIRTDATKRMG